MDKIISINVSDINDADGSCNLLVAQKIIDEGQVIVRRNWRCVLPKNSDLTTELQTTFGPVVVSDYRPEAEFLLSKWAELES